VNTRKSYAWIVALIFVMLLVACSGPAAAPTPVPPSATPIPPTATAVPPTVTPIPPTATPELTATAVPIPTAEPTETATTRPTATSAPTETPAPTNTPAPGATVKIATLRVRSGPGGNYDAIGSARQGDILPVIGQTADCAWLQVSLAQKPAWVAGGSEYVTLNVPCSVLPAAALPPTRVPVPTATSRPAAVAADLTGADWQTIARVLVDQARYYLPMLRETQALMEQTSPTCTHLRPLLDVLLAAPRYREIAKTLWSWRGRPGVEGEIWSYLDAYSAGFDPFRQDVFRVMRDGCAAGQEPSAELRQQGLSWLRLLDAVSKLEHVINNLGPQIGR
jgi:uncharacterized protein YraI